MTRDPIKTLLIGVLLGGALSSSAFTVFAPKPSVIAPDTVVVVRSAKAETVAVTTLRTTTRERWRVDSLLRVDTVPLTLRETTFVRVIDTLLVACERCGRELASFRVFADSVRKSDRDSIAKLTRALQSCRASRPWYAVAGAGVSLLACSR